MRKVKVFLMAMLAMVSMSLVSCNSCSNEKDDNNVITSLNFDSIVRADYEQMCSNVNGDSPEDGTVFYEAQVWFDTTIDNDFANVVKIMTVFQYKDTCTQIFHTLINGVQVDSVATINDFWLEDMTTTPYNTISFDSALIIARKSGNDMYGCMAVMRRPLFPPFPEENYYIFGSMMESVCVDSKDGHLVEEY